jgi:hypothetical protein
MNVGGEGRIVYLGRNGPKNFKKCPSWAPVAHAYNPSYSGDREQKDFGSKPTWTVYRCFGFVLASISKKKKNHIKKGLVEWLKQ